MKSKSIWFQPKRLGALTVTYAFLAQCISPAHATMSQVPGTYGTPPDVNVMFTLDSSGSMAREFIPDGGDGIGDNAMWSKNWTDNGANGLRQTFLSDSQIWRYYRSSDGNPLYYNPRITYKPWVFATDDTKLYPNANPAAACWYDAKLPIDFTWTYPVAQATFTGKCAAANKKNLTKRIVTASGTDTGEQTGYWPATYFMYVGETPLLQNATATQSANSTSAVWKKIEITDDDNKTYDKAETRTDCTTNAKSCTRSEEIQNFANWFQYHRTRALMAKAAVGKAFSLQSKNIRLGFGTIHGVKSGTKTVGTNIDGQISDFIKLGVRRFENTGTAKDRDRIYSSLYSVSNAQGTALRKAVYDVGQYFRRKGPGNPWAEDPSNTQSVGKEYICRKSFHILTTDGYWNNDGDAENLTGKLVDVGNTADDFTKFVAPGLGSAKTGSTFSDDNTDSLTINPFKGKAGTTSLSDYVAANWKNDLRDDLNNNLSTTPRDPAYWQHVSTFTVGIGVSSNMKEFNGTTTAARQSQIDKLIADKTAIDWSTPEVNTDDSRKGDDLIHASMTGRGRFFLALDSDGFARDLAAALGEVASHPSSSSNLEGSSKTAGTGFIYQATFDANTWFGRLYSFKQQQDGSVDDEPRNASWEASQKMDPPKLRNIFTLKPTSPVKTVVPFEWNSLADSQKTLLGNDENVLNFLRGSDANEVTNGGLFRKRVRSEGGGVLGDIINSSPVKGPEAGGGYDKMRAGAAGKSTYAAYRSKDAHTLGNLLNTLFVGANDGMLHAFNTEDGKERFAYVPGSVYSVRKPGAAATDTEPKLKMLSDLNYQHRYTVDGPIQIGDAYWGTDPDQKNWKTILMGSTGAGARSVFAMDVSNPKVEANGFSASKILWEFSEADDKEDMGNVLSYPHIARMRVFDETKSVAIFGNGYDSLNGQAVLYIVDLADGKIIKKIKVGKPGIRNGLSQPNFTLNGEREVQTIYAGDLKGNLWKFDVSTNSDPATWVPAFGSAPEYSPLYKGSPKQPITVMPEITYHSSGGALVSFGTGKLFETEDIAETKPVLSDPNDPNSTYTGNINLESQALFGIWDKPGGAIVSGKGDLVEQKDLSLTQVADKTLTGTSSNTIDWTTKRGWYLTLVNTGERVNVNPYQVKDVLLVVANTPVPDPCAMGGESRLFALDPLTGAAPKFVVFDTDGNGSITTADQKGYNVRAFAHVVASLPLVQSQKPLQTGVTTEPLWNNRGQTSALSGGVELKPTSPTDCAGRMHVGTSAPDIQSSVINLCGPGRGRVSWRQIK